MDEWKELLENSSIHGLVHISKTKRLRRLFWVLIIILGFSGAGILIHQSFSTWSDSPVKTTIETLPISKITLPNIIVCPPKNTFTNLNYDLINLGNQTIETDLLNFSTPGYQLLKRFVKHFQNLDYEKSLAKINKFYEKNKFRHWYYGVSALDPATLRGNSIDTFAASGTVSSPYFGHNFNADNFELEATYTLHIKTKNQIPRKNDSVMIEIYYSIMSPPIESLRVATPRRIYLDPNKKIYETSVGNFDGMEIKFRRKFSPLEFLNWHNKEFTGFRVHWKNLNSTSSTNYYFENNIRYYVNVTNLIHIIGNSSKVWDTVREVKFEWMDVLQHPEPYGYTSPYTYPFGTKTMNDLYNEILLSIASKFDVQHILNFPQDGISDETLKFAAKIFIYLKADQQDFWLQWHKVYGDLMDFYSLRRILGIEQLLQL